MKLLIRSIVPTCMVLVLHTGFSQSPITAIPFADAQVFSNSATTNYGTTDKAYVWVEATPTKYYRYYANFKISDMSIPSDAIIYKAELTLKPVSEGGAADNAFVVQTVTNTWSETGITFAAQPSTSTVNQVTTSTLSSGRRVFDVKTMVQAIVSGSLTDYGWQIRRNAESTNTSPCQYNTKEAASADQPKLSITYYRPMSITAATVVHATNSASADGSITPTITNGSGLFTYQWTNSSGTTLVTTAALTGCAPGWYGLKVTGQYGDVYYMAFIVGALCETVSITFNPGPNFIDDAFLWGLPANTGLNYGTNTTLQAGSLQSGTWYESRSLLKFRLWFDPAMTPVKALMHLTGSSHSTAGRTNDAILARVTQAWNETTVTYTNQPGYSTSISADVSPTASATESKDIDLLSLWNYWRNNNTSNHGMLLKLDTYAALTAKQEYHSSDASTAANWPYIVFLVDHATCDKTSYTTFKSDQDAAYTRTFQGKLKIRFTEEYSQTSGKKVPLTLYDVNKHIVASIRYDGTIIPGSGSALLPAVTYTFDENNATLNLTSLGLTQNQYYILELTKSTGEKEYIKFIYSN